MIHSDYGDDVYTSGRHRAGARGGAKPIAYMSHLTYGLVYRIDDDAIVIADVFMKKSWRTPKAALERNRRRLARYDEA